MSFKESVYSEDPQSNKINMAAEEKFLGEQVNDTFTLHKKYIIAKGRNLRLYHRRYTPLKNVSATLCIIHGFGEHSGRFSHVAEFFCRRGMDVLMVDLRGFGYSGGARGTATFNQLLMDVGVLVEQSNSQLPLFLYGHSMGGLVVLSFALLNPQINFAGVVATSPLIGLPSDRNLNWFKVKILSTISKDLEDMVMNSMVNPTALTKDDSFLQHAFADRLLLPFLGVHMAAGLLQAIQSIRSHAAQFSNPLLLLHGKQDSVTDYKDSLYFYEKCGSQEKSIKLFPNGYHELQHDEEFDELKNVVAEWFDRRLETAQPIGRMLIINSEYPQEKRKYSKTKIVILIALFLYFILLIKNRNHPLATNALKKLLIPFLVLLTGRK